MALFSRNKPVDTVPQEVREYYQSERRERASVAWLLALGTLVVTLLLASGIFFGGKWVYREITHKNNKGGGSSQIAQSSNNADSNSNNGNQKTGTSSTSTSTPSSGANSSNASSSTNSKPNGASSTTGSSQNQSSSPQAGTSSSSSSSSTTSSSSATAPQQSATPPASTPTNNTPTSSTPSSRLVNTGPGDTIAVFLVAVVAGMGIHYLLIARRAAE